MYIPLPYNITNFLTLPTVKHFNHYIAITAEPDFEAIKKYEKEIFNIKKNSPRVLFNQNSE